jgi:hypothetical protein
MKELYIEGLAIHDDPNHAWVLVRASAKRWKGHVQARLLSREIKEFGVSTRSKRVEGNIAGGVIASRQGTPRGQGTRACTESSCARTGRSHVLPVWLITGRAAQGTPRRYA